MSNHEIIIRMEEIRKIYDTGKIKVEALKGINLEIEKGELVAIVGPSGSGKSTLLNIMGTLDRPSSGVVRVTGIDIAGLSDRQLAALRATRIGFVRYDYPGRKEPHKLEAPARGQEPQAPAPGCSHQPQARRQSNDWKNPRAGACGL